MMVNGQNNNQEYMYVDSGDISHHIVQVLPFNQDFLDPKTVLGRELEELKFEVHDIDTA